MTAPAADGQHILEPPLPYDMKPRARRAARDVRLQQFVHHATDVKHRGRIDACETAFGDRYDAMRSLAGRIKQHTLDHLDVYLDRFIERATRAGVRVHVAADAAEARAIGLDIATSAGCHRCVKSKSMVTEEIRLLPALEAAGIETVETDLGEFIVQLDDDAPSHIVTPIIHKDRTAVARAFERELGAPYTEDPAQLTAIAREHLRRKYREADLGISGGNFLVADTGSVVVCTNEGNADLAVSGPRVHIAFVGIEKLVPTLGHLPVFLKLLARSATAQDLTVYTTLVTGPRRHDDHDGPEEVHVVLVDNGRTRILEAETRELLRCIRCGACLNACPVYRNVGGGHAYGAVYSGPIGAVITPLLAGEANYVDLPHASSLCGACKRACPVDIDIPRQLVAMRRRMVEQRITSRRERVALRLWAWCLRRSVTYRVVTAVQRIGLRVAAGRGDGGGRYEDRRWVERTGGVLSPWTARRDLPTPTSSSFRDWWRRREREDGP